MTKLFFWDTETTGLPLFHEPSDSPGQPHIVQLACMLVDEDSRGRIDSDCVIVRPDGWEIPQEATDIHGITQAHAETTGVPVAEMIELFHTFLGLCDRQAGFNISFDKRMMRIQLKRAGMYDEMTRLKEFPYFCCMRQSTAIIRMPATAAMHATGRHHSKSPSLIEAHKFFFGEPPATSHEAMADVKSTVKVYFAIKDWIAEHGEPAKSAPKKRQRRGPGSARKPRKPKAAEMSW